MNPFLNYVLGAFIGGGFVLFMLAAWDKAYGNSDPTATLASTESPYAGFELTATPTEAATRTATRTPEPTPTPAGWEVREPPIGTSAEVEIGVLTAWCLALNPRLTELYQLHHVPDILLVWAALLWEPVVPDRPCEHLAAAIMSVVLADN